MAKKVFRFNPASQAFPPPCKRESASSLSPLLRSSVALRASLLRFGKGC